LLTQARAWTTWAAAPSQVHDMSRCTHMNIHIYTREYFFDTMKAGQGKNFIFIAVDLLKKFFDFFAAA
jgi:hypothetical protein